MTDETGPKIEVDSVRYESGVAKVRIVVNGIVADFDPPTARAIAMALIHRAEVAGFSPPEPEPEAA